MRHFVVCFLVMVLHSWSLLHYASGQRPLSASNTTVPAVATATNVSGKRLPGVTSFPGNTNPNNQNASNKTISNNLSSNARSNSFNTLLNKLSSKGGTAGGNGAGIDSSPADNPSNTFSSRIQKQRRLKPNVTRSGEAATGNSINDAIPLPSSIPPVTSLPYLFDEEDESSIDTNATSYSISETPSPDIRGSPIFPSGSDVSNSRPRPSNRKNMRNKYLELKNAGQQLPSGNSTSFQNQNRRRPNKIQELRNMTRQQPSIVPGYSNPYLKKEPYSDHYGEDINLLPVMSNRAKQPNQSLPTQLETSLAAQDDLDDPGNSGVVQETYTMENPLEIYDPEQHNSYQGVPINRKDPVQALKTKFSDNVSKVLDF